MHVPEHSPLQPYRGVHREPTCRQADVRAPSLELAHRGAALLGRAEPTRLRSPDRGRQALINLSRVVVCC
jgi:hypothetical protein